MNEKLSFQLQAYLDAELDTAERQEVEALLKQDAAARDLLTELRNTNAALAEFEAELKLPEPAEFHWSKIKREIARREVAPVESRPSLGSWLRRMLVPAGAFAAVVIAVLVSLPQAESMVPSYTTTSEAVAFTYQNYETGTTLVWLDYSSQNDVADAVTKDKIGL